MCNFKIKICRLQDFFVTFKILTVTTNLEDYGHNLESVQSLFLFNFGGEFVKAPLVNPLLKSVSCVPPLRGGTLITGGVINCRWGLLAHLSTPDIHR